MSNTRPWTLDQVRLQLREAAHTLQRLPRPRYGFPSSYRTAWPDVVRDWMGYGWDHTQMAPIPPTPEEIDRLDDTLDWIWLLSRDQRVILWARSQPIPWPWKQIQELDALEHHGRQRTVHHLRSIMHDAEYRILNHLNQTPQRAVINPDDLSAKPKCSAAR